MLPFRHLYSIRTAFHSIGGVGVGNSRRWCLTFCVIEKGCFNLISEKTKHFDDTCRQNVVEVIQFIIEPMLNPPTVIIKYYNNLSLHFKSFDILLITNSSAFVHVQQLVEMTLKYLLGIGIRFGLNCDLQFIIQHNYFKLIVM